ncbi:MAG: MFS transporter [Firmicutes bacterium]|nr:MFS transporter [Bacillota bacterium]
MEGRSVPYHLPYYKRNLYVLSFTIFLAAVSWNQVVPFLPIFLRDLGVPDSDLAQWSGIIFAMQSVSGIVMQPLWGKLADRFGRKPMVVRAGICLVLIYMGMSICKTAWQLAIFRFLNGALTGFIPGSIALIATNTPELLSGRYVAIAQTASATGGIIGPAIGGALAGLFGFRGAMQISGVVVLFSTLLVIWIVKEPNKASINVETSLLEDFRIAVRNPVLLVVMGTTMIAWIVSGAIQPILTIYLEQLSSVEAHWLSGIVFSLPGLGFLLTAYRWSCLGERISYYGALLRGLIGTGLSVFALALVTNIWQFAIFYFVSGVFMAAIAPCAAALIATKVDESFRGRAYGIQQAAGTMGGFVAPLAGGMIGGLLGLRYVFVFTAAVSLLGALMLRGKPGAQRVVAPTKMQARLWPHTAIPWKGRPHN